MDEAASRLKMEIESQPTELDRLERRLLQLSIERQALAKEDDPASRERLTELEQELSEVQGERDAMHLRWENEKRQIDEVREIKEQLERMRLERRSACAAAIWRRAAEIRHGAMPALQRRLDRQAAELAGDEEDPETGGTARLLREEVSEEDIAAVVSQWTGIPVSKMLESERRRLLELERILGDRVVGQDDAIAAVADAIRRNKSGLADPEQPLGTFIFLGPTGVGKTELAKALAAWLFDDERALTRIDMSEYMEKHAVSRLIGAPPGYVGYEEGGQLTEAVRRRPYSVVLFDELEKAHPDVFNALLQLLDDGRLTDGQGRVVDFRNTIVIMTSNVGSDLIQSARDLQDVGEQIGALMRATFRPEFLNRVDETILFHRLERRHIERIVRIQLDQIAERLRGRRIELSVTAAACDYLAERGFDPQFGARPLKRTLTSLVQNPLARRLIAGEVADGSTVTVDLVNGELVDGELVFGTAGIGAPAVPAGAS